jgi:gamma-glutamyltranspeptidase/glutathione hydrolase
VLGVVDGGLSAADAVNAPRLHVEGREIDAEPGIDAGALDELEGHGWTVRRWAERNLYFGGVQAVARSRETGELGGAGDPRRDGAAVVVDG